MSRDSNLRAIQRMRALKGARFILPNYSGSGIDCRIVDIHSRGARLCFDSVIPVRDPKAELMIFPENKLVPVRVAWQKGLENGMEMGVEFDKPLEWLERHDLALEIAAPAA